MNRSIITAGIVLSAVTMGMTSVSHASIVSFDLAPQNNKDLGKVADFHDGSNAYTITGRGYDTKSGAGNLHLGDTWKPSSVHMHDLYSKHGGYGETGLGLKSGGRLKGDDNEIEANSFVQLDLTSIIKAGLDDISLSIGSIQKGEGFYVWGSNDVGKPGKLLAEGEGGPDVQRVWNADPHESYNYISVSGSRGDVLLLCLEACKPSDPNGGSSPVPEPASLGLLAVGGAGLLARRRKA